MRTDSVKIKKGRIKMHSIADMPARAVLDYLVTGRNVADITGLRTVLERFEGGFGNFCLDSAYLAREIRSAISKQGHGTAHLAQIQHDPQRPGQSIMA